MATTADGRAEREAAMLMLHERVKRRGRRRRTVGADKGYDTHEFVELTRALGVTPHVTQNTRAARRQRHRWPHDTARGLREKSARAPAHRARLRLVEDHWVAPQDQTPRARERRLARRLRERRVQFASPRGAERDTRLRHGTRRSRGARITRHEH